MRSLFGPVQGSFQERRDGLTRAREGTEPTRMRTLVLMRHGATLWGEENRFAGWGDTPLSETGEKEARKAAARSSAAASPLMSATPPACAEPSRRSTSRWTRCGCAISPSVANGALNERHYGALQGETRSAMIQRYGNSQVVEWRRSFDAIPPALEENDPRWQEQLGRLPQIPAADQPRTESMAQAADRVAPVWHEAIKPDLAPASNCWWSLTPARCAADRLIEGSTTRKLRTSVSRRPFARLRFR